MAEKFVGPEGAPQEREPLTTDKLRQYEGVRQWREALGRKPKPIFSFRELEKLHGARLQEMARLGRGGVIEKMLRQIPDVTEKLRERERQEIATEVGRYIFFLETQVKENKGLVAELEGATAKGTVKIEEAEEIRSFVAELREDIAKYEEEIEKLRAQLEQLGVGSKPEEQGRRS
ncbi:hypothetical protein C4587_00010 [Candidatus Parcubacteria bacterium]|nr:MAG: hypothetical protein C4587_00010 [Candidatus Parcubacteria bacterium]